MKHAPRLLGEICQIMQINCPPGSESTVIDGIATLEDADSGDISYLTNPKYAAQAAVSKAGAILVHEGVEVESATLLLPCPDPYLAFAIYMTFLGRETDPAPGIDAAAQVAEGAQLGEDVYIGAGAIVQADVVVGDRCYIGPGAKILNGSRLGNQVRIESGAVISSEGFGFAPDKGGRFHRIPQLGQVVLEDHVSIGANTTIDRATLGATHIGEGCKIDNLCMIAHNVRIGAHTVMAAQVGVAGSTVIGKHCQFGGQVGVAGHITIGDNVTVLAQSGVASSVPSNRSIFGSPAIEHRTFLKAYAAFKRNGEK